MAQQKDESFFSRLTRLFRSGPSIRRKIKGYDDTGYYDKQAALANKGGQGALPFRRGSSQNSSFSMLGGSDMMSRMTRYQEFASMEYTPIISKALDILSDEACSGDENGKNFHIYSDNARVKETLEELFYDILNVDFNLRVWFRNLPVSKNTIIPLLDGRNITIEALAKEFQEGKKNWVYSIQDNTRAVVPGQVTWCGVTRKNSVITRVTLDDGTYVDTTPDHEYMLRNGKFCQAQNLSPGTSLMPFYTKTSTAKERLSGYEKVFNPATNYYKFTHQAVASNLFKEQKVFEKQTGEKHVTHHANFNKLDNSPPNLVRMSAKEHAEFHANHAKSILRSPEVTKKRKEAVLKWLQSDKHKDMARIQLKLRQDLGLMPKSWANYNNSQKHSEDNIVRRASMKQLWQNPVKANKCKKMMSLSLSALSEQIIVQHLQKMGSFTGLKTLCKSLRTDKLFVEQFAKDNEHSKRNLVRAINETTLQSLLARNGHSSYVEFVGINFPDYQNDREFKIASGIRATRKAKIINHKVISVKTLSGLEDVYCMEVLGQHGEHDRHNFAVCSHNISSNETTRNGVFVANCKYGDFFLYNEVAPGVGVVNVMAMNVNEVERDEGFDSNDPYAVRFKWHKLGTKDLENWQVTHFRILGNDRFNPYGTSVLEAARKFHSQYIMMIDAMLVYRLVRSPERRVFYVDVGTVAPNDIPNYMQTVMSTIRGNTAVDKSTGRLDERFNPTDVLEDYVVPVRGANSGTKIDTLSGASNATATEDIQIIESQLFSALGVPKAYLGYDDMLSSKATLAQEDIRFSRTVQILQKIVISELNKLAILHLYAKGFEGEDLIDFELRLSNPSTIALQQKLDLWKTKIDIIGAVDNIETRFLPMHWLYKEILGFTEDEIAGLRDKLKEDKKFAVELDAINTPDDTGQNTVDPFDPTSYHLPGGMPLLNPAPQKPSPSGSNAVSLPPDADDSPSLRMSLGDKEMPIKDNPQVRMDRRNQDRRHSSLSMQADQPDFRKMLNPSKNQSLKDVFDSEFLKSSLTENLEKDLKKVGIGKSAYLSKQMKSILESFDRVKRIMTNELPAEIHIIKEYEESDLDVDLDDLLAEDISTDKSVTLVDSTSTNNVPSLTELAELGLDLKETKDQE